MNVRFDNRKRLNVVKLLSLAVVLFASFNLLHCVKRERGEGEQLSVEKAGDKLHKELIDITEQIVKKRREVLKLQQEALQLQRIRELKRYQCLKVHVDQLIEFNVLPVDFQLGGFDLSEGLEEFKETLRDISPLLNSWLTRPLINSWLTQTRTDALNPIREQARSSGQGSSTEFLDERKSIGLRLAGLGMEDILGSIHADHGRRLLKIFGKIREAYQEGSVQGQKLTFEFLNPIDSEAPTEGESVNTEGESVNPSVKRLIDEPQIQKLVDILKLKYDTEVKELSERLNKLRSMAGIDTCLSPQDSDEMETDEGHACLYLMIMADHTTSKGSLPTEAGLDLHKHKQPTSFYIRQKNQVSVVRAIVKRLIKKDYVVNLLTCLSCGRYKNKRFRYYQLYPPA